VIQLPQCSVIFLLTTTPDYGSLFVFGEIFVMFNTAHSQYSNDSEIE